MYTYIYIWQLVINDHLHNHRQSPLTMCFFLTKADTPTACSLTAWALRTNGTLGRWTFGEKCYTMVLIYCAIILFCPVYLVSFTGIMSSSYPALFIYSQFHWDYVIILSCPVYLQSVSLGLCHHLILPCLSTVSFTGIMSSYPALFIYSQFHWDYVIILSCPVYPLFIYSFIRIMSLSYPAQFIYSQFHSDYVIMLYCLSTVSFIIVQFLGLGKWRSVACTKTKDNSLNFQKERKRSQFSFLMALEMLAQLSTVKETC